MKMRLHLAALLALLGTSPLAAQGPPGALSGSTGGGRPSNGGGAVPPSTRPLTTRDVPAGIPRNDYWLGQSKGRQTPGTGVDRTRAGFGGIAPGDPGGPATRPDAGLGNPSIATARPDRGGLGNPSVPRTRPDVGFGDGVRVFHGFAKTAGIVNPGWARKSGNAAAPSTAAAGRVKGVQWARTAVPATGGYTAEPLQTPVRTPPRPGRITRPVPQTGITTPGTAAPPAQPGTPVRPPTGATGGSGTGSTTGTGSGVPGTGTVNPGG